MELPLKALLVPLDGSKAAERAVAPAARLARLARVPLTLFHWDFDPHEGALTGEYLDTLVNDLDVPADVQVVVNADLPESIAAAAEDRAATICMATHGRSGIARATLGSVAEEVLNLSHRPTVLIGSNIEPAASPRSGRLVVCVDGSELSEAGLPTAVSWANQLEGPVEVVHVLDPSVPELLPAGSADVIDSGYLQRVAHRLEVTPAASFEVLHGPAAKAIAGHVGPDVELVALTTHGRTGIRRVALGSVAMELAHRSHRPVLVIPPVIPPAPG